MPSELGKEQVLSRFSWRLVGAETDSDTKVDKIIKLRDLIESILVVIKRNEYAWELLK